MKMTFDDAINRKIYDKLKYENRNCLFLGKKSCHKKRKERASLSLSQHGPVWFVG